MTFILIDWMRNLEPVERWQNSTLEAQASFSNNAVVGSQLDRQSN